MSQRPAQPVFRIVLISLFLFMAILACVAIAYTLLTRPPNSSLNPIESLVLKVQLSQRSNDLQTPAGGNPQPVCFSVNQGDNATTIGANLARQNLVKDGDLFRMYARYYGLDANLQAGVYALRQTLTIPQIASILTNVGANSLKFQVIEGKRIEEIAEAIDRADPPLSFTGKDFLALVGPGSTARSDIAMQFAQREGIPAGQSLEGFLFPDTYTLPTCSQADALVTRMLQNFDNKVTPDMRAAAQAENLTLYQVVTLASIVEREAVIADERPIIASVYLNRIHANMPLDADPTIQYALGNTRDPNTWWPPISVADYSGVNNSYNTYLVFGLPPGPIANPGLSSIQAVVTPQNTPYLYFRATCNGDGHHNFATTLAQQEANACP